MSASANISDLERYDKIVYLVREAPERQRGYSAWAKLLPHYDGTEYNQAVVTDTFLEMYNYHRALGLPKSSTAHLLGISEQLLNDLFLGKGLRIETIVDLYLMELGARAEFRKNHLKTLNEASIKGMNWKASVAALELICPEEFARRDEADDAPPLNITSYDDPTYEDVGLPDVPD